jgi:serine/threonine protein kinase/predicted Zn-dependent protease
MQSERWQTCTELFAAAVEQSPDERAAFLERSCEGDERLRRKVELLLKYHDSSGDFIESPAFEVAPEFLVGDPQTLVGQHLGGYRVDAVAGVGGMGVVYLAWDKRLGRKVALKLLPQSMVANEADLDRLEKEARTASALNHPNIVTIHDIGEVESTHYIATEFIEGTTLRERMNKGPIGTREAVDIAAQVASALCVAHRAGIVHRDIKPENIMLRPDGYVKVLDFGIAKLTQQETVDTTKARRALLPTQQSVFVGTTRYMSPEQAMAHPVDARSDLWSLGVVLYEMLAGRAPFEADAATNVIAAICETDPEPLKECAPVIPPALRAVVKRALRKSPAERYQSAEEMFSDLRANKENTYGAAARSAKRIPVAAVAAMLVGLALFYAWRARRPAPVRAMVTAEKSIAVLPLQNLSEDKENAFFADGVQDELLSSLSKIKDLKVISRTSVMRYNSSTKRNLKDIAQQLGVRNVIEGSVRRSGDHLRVSVQLIDGRTDQHLWGQTYDRKMVDSVGLQGELATEITAAVGATLSPQEKARIEAKRTNNPAAYDAYLRARALPSTWAYFLQSDLEDAIRLYQQAVNLDPKFALAWAYLSVAHSKTYSLGLDPTSFRLKAAKDALDRALTLDSNLPEVHLASGYYRYCERDNTGALAEFQQVEEGLPNSIDVIEAIAMAQKALGNWDESIAELGRAIELDPRNVTAPNNLALTYADLRRFPQALATLDRVLAWDPMNARALLTKLEIFLATGNLEAAEPLLAKSNVPSAYKASYMVLKRRYAEAAELLSGAVAVESDQGDLELIRSLAQAQQLAGDISAARATYQKAVQNLQRQLKSVAPGSFEEAWRHKLLSEDYAGLGEAAAAVDEGQKAMAVCPTSKNAWGGPIFEVNMAEIYATLGDADHAIPILQRVLRLPCGFSITPELLRLDPLWDPIRTDPRFIKLTAEKRP